MNIFPIIKNIIKNNDPNKIYSFNQKYTYKQIKDNWVSYLNKTYTDELKDIFDKSQQYGSIGKDIGILNIYNIKNTKEIFGIYYCNFKTEYLKINSNNIKKILDDGDNLMILSYIIKNRK